MKSLNHLLEEWVLGLVVLIFTFILATTFRATLNKIHKDRGWRVLREIAPSLSNLLYIVGLKIFVDAAPLHGKAELWAEGFVYALSVVICLSLLRKAVLFGIEWSALKTENSEVLHLGFIPLLKNVITLFVFLTASIMILKHFNYDVMSLVTALGVSSLAVGLAAKETLSNMISGFILIIDQNLRPGDRINLAGSIGDVVEIGLRSTQIRTSEGNLLIVPNSELVNTKILNLSVPTREATCSTVIRIPYDVSFGKVKSSCLSIIESLNQLAKERPPSVNLVNLSDGHQLIQIGFWVSDIKDAGAAITEFHEKLLSRLKEESIPLLPPPPSALSR
jgi:small-conductance mechanosensitive channel